MKSLNVERGVGKDYLVIHVINVTQDWRYLDLIQLYWCNNF